MKNQESNWYRLDNQAKIFPVVYNKRNPQVFRLQVALNEVVEPDILQIAVDHMLQRFPVFKVKLRTGLFWSFLEENTKPFFIQKMTHIINEAMDFKENNDYLFKVLYHDNTIAIETFHTLSDGTGIVEFLKSLTYEYLSLKGYELSPDNVIRTTNERPLNNESEDSSLAYYSGSNNKHEKEEKAFIIKGTPTEDHEVKLTSGIFSTKEIIQLAKKNNATITEYITALMIQSIYITQIQYRAHTSKRPIKIGVPVNLRTRFPSRTLRNFVNIVGVTVRPENNNLSFEEILEIVKSEIKEKTTLEELQRMMSEYVSYEKNILVRILPFAIKKYVLKIGYNLIGSVLFTLSLSNVGRFTLPDSMKPYVKDASFMVSCSDNNKINCSIISFEDRFKISFTSNILETDVQKEFFRALTSQGLSCEIESNYLEENNENMR